jgi:hypothetical protein
VAHPGRQADDCGPAMMTSLSDGDEGVQPPSSLLHVLSNCALRLGNCCGVSTLDVGGGDLYWGYFRLRSDPVFEHAHVAIVISALALDSSG